MKSKITAWNKMSEITLEPEQLKEVLKTAIAPQRSLLILSMKIRSQG
jgi:hypothetical protein